MRWNALRRCLEADFPTFLNRHHDWLRAHTQIQATARSSHAMRCMINIYGDGHTLLWQNGAQKDKWHIRKCSRMWGRTELPQLSCPAEALVCCTSASGVSPRRSILSQERVCRKLAAPSKVSVESVVHHRSQENNKIGPEVTLGR